MWEQIVDLAHKEIVAYAGMILILSAFFLETRDILNSKEWPYLVLMALGSGLLAVRAYLIDEWAFFILEVAWFAAAALGLWSITKANRDLSFHRPKFLMVCFSKTLWNAPLLDVEINGYSPIPSVYDIVLIVNILYDRCRPIVRQVPIFGDIRATLSPIWPNPGIFGNRILIAITIPRAHVR